MRLWKKDYASKQKKSLLAQYYPGLIVCPSGSSWTRRLSTIDRVENPAIR
jgi:hypothetical protein